MIRYTLNGAETPPRFFLPERADFRRLKPGGLTAIGFCFFRQLSALAVLMACALISTLSAAQPISGKVVSVTDGDTITVLDENRKQHKIRLGGIDAPERSQPFGQKSKAHLASLVFGRTVEVESNKKDRYQRTVGKVTINGQDANLAMIVAGYAWHYKKYQNEQPLGDRHLYTSAEQDAREARIGLWRDPHPIPPWEWRKGAR